MGMNEKKSELLIQEAFQTMLRNTEDMIFVKDVDSVYVAASLAWIKMAGKETLEDVINKTDLEIFEDENLAERYRKDDKKLLAEGKDLVDYMEPITDEDGHARYGSTSKYLLYGPDGKPNGILGITKDITRDYIIKQHYQKELSCLFELPEDVYAISYIDVDSWRLISQRRQNIEEGTLQLCHTVEELCQAAVESIKDEACPAAQFYRDFTPENLCRLYAEGNSYWRFEYEREMTNGDVRWVENEAKFLANVESGHLCIMLKAKDIHEEKKEEQHIITAAKFDGMTMLLNRDTTMNSIRDVLIRERNGEHALFMIDIDNFKVLNDTLGHQVGDEFLSAVAGILHEGFRDTDVVGRIGGDEFFALMRNVGDVRKLAVKATSLLEGISKIDVGPVDLQVSGSIGISMYPEDGRTLEELYTKADNALYEAKRHGKNRFVFSK